MTEVAPLWKQFSDTNLQAIFFAPMNEALENANKKKGLRISQGQDIPTARYDAGVVGSPYRPKAPAANRSSVGGGSQAKHFFEALKSEQRLALTESGIELRMVQYINPLDGNLYEFIAFAADLSPDSISELGYQKGLRSVQEQALRTQA